MVRAHKKLSFWNGFGWEFLTQNLLFYYFTLFHIQDKNIKSPKGLFIENNVLLYKPCGKKGKDPQTAI